MPRPPYKGVTRKLLLAFDVGTTFSGVSYSIMDPGEVPEIRTVTRFPEQIQAGADSKIPSVVYYDRDMNVCAVGGEAMREGIEGIAEEEGWTKAEWFKLHLRPRKRGWSTSRSLDIPPLPPKQTVVKVFADYVKYLYDCTKTYIKETHANGEILWKSLEANAEYVFTHPNGWEGAQQSQMREAAKLAGLVKDDEQTTSRISFVTEGEASLHYCINSGLNADAFEKGKGIIIVDAGGGTIDISAYKGKNKVFQEICAPQCHFQGAVFVTSRARKHIEDTLRGSRFAEDVPYIVDRFDKRTKHAFRDETAPQFIQFASTRESEPDLGIRFGQLKLQGTTVAKFYEPSISCIVNAIEGLKKKSQCPISAVFLVGGFAASDWLYSEVKKRLEGKGLAVSRPDSHMSKAVSDGAASFYLDHFVGYRIAKAHYGVEVQAWYDPKLPHHLKRAHLVKCHPVVGTLVLDDRFDIILPKDELVAETKEYRHSYRTYYENGDKVSTISTAIISYNRESPSCWIDEEPELYNIVCWVEADVSGIKRTSASSSLGISCYCIEYDIVLLFGLTELRAQIAWVENGVEKRGPAKVIYEAD